VCTNDSSVLTFASRNEIMLITIACRACSIQDSSMAKSSWPDKAARRAGVGRVEKVRY
jgi:hypothetical protein